MALVACGNLPWPALIFNGGSNFTTGISTASATLDSTTDAIALVQKSYVTDSIAVIYFRTGSIPAGGGDTVDVRIEKVANGRPTGALWDANGTGPAPNITVAIADSDDGVWKTATLTDVAVLVPTDEFAIVIASSAGTPNINLVASSSSFTPPAGQYPVQLQNATGAYAAPVSSSGPWEWIVSMTNAGIIYMPGMLPVDGNGTISAMSTGGTEERALRFQVPFKCRVIGMRAAIFNVAAGADSTWSLWDATGDSDAEALAQVLLDGDYPYSTTVDGFVEVFFDTAVTLSIGTTYYIGVRADTANALSLGELTTAGTGQPANSMRGFPIPATGQIYSASRDWTAGAGGAWSTVTTTLPLMHIIIDQLDDGEGGSGSAGMLFRAQGVNQ